MRKLVIGFISTYQVLAAVVIKQLFGIPMFCRFRPTCSDYTKQMIMQYGLRRGGYLGLRRILSCNPFTRYGTI